MTNTSVKISCAIALAFNHLVCNNNHCVFIHRYPHPHGYNPSTPSSRSSWRDYDDRPGRSSDRSSSSQVYRNNSSSNSGNSRGVQRFNDSNSSRGEYYRDEFNSSSRGEMDSDYRSSSYVRRGGGGDHNSGSRDYRSSQVRL